MKSVKRQTLGVTRDLEKVRSIFMVGDSLFEKMKVNFLVVERFLWVVAGGKI